MTFGSTLHQLRTDRKLTQSALAAAAGVGPNTISALERDSRVEKRIYWETVQALARALNVDVGVFVNGRDEK